MAGSAAEDLAAFDVPTIDTLYESFILGNDLSLKCFLRAWAKVKFVSIYDKKSERGCIQLVSDLLQKGVESLDRCNCIERRVFSLYLLSCVFLTQPLPKIPIKITLKLMNELEELISRTADIPDVLTVAKGLNDRNAYCITYSFTTYGPRTNKSSSEHAKVDHKLAQDRFNSLKKSLLVHVGQISQVHKEYEEIKKSQKEVLEVMEPVSEEILEYSKTIDNINPSKSTSTKATEAEDIGQRRRRLKNK